MKSNYEETQVKPKRARRKIKSLDFSQEGAAVALVGPAVGGPANGIPTLIMKSASEIEHDILMQDIDAEIQKELDEVEAIEKASVNQSESVQTEDETSIVNEEAEVTTSNVQLEKGSSMDETNVQADEAMTSIETVAKAEFESVQKALDETKALLQKSMETIAAFEAEKKQAIAKAKTEKIQAIVKNEKHTAALAKASLQLESEDDFSAFMSALQAMMNTVETSEMFMEKGATVDEAVEAPQESAVARILKAQYSNSK